MDVWCVMVVWLVVYEVGWFRVFFVVVLARAALGRDRAETNLRLTSRRDDVIAMRRGRATTRWFLVVVSVTLTGVGTSARDARCQAVHRCARRGTV